MPYLIRKYLYDNVKFALANIEANCMCKDYYLESVLSLLDLDKSQYVASILVAGLF